MKAWFGSNPKIFNINMGEVYRFKGLCKPYILSVYVFVNHTRFIGGNKKC